ncbi:MAG: hypothetical protein V4517_09395 [Pseudomonadota bacterium]
MADKPASEFGTRKPVAIRPPQPVKRGQVALLLMGTLAVGGGAYAMMPSENCEYNQPGMASPSGLTTNSECRPRGSSSGGHGYSGGSSSRSSAYSAGSSSNHASGTPSDSSSGHVTRGGFGGFAHTFSSHFSGGG